MPSGFVEAWCARLRDVAFDPAAHPLKWITWQSFEQVGRRCQRTAELGAIAVEPCEHRQVLLIASASLASHWKNDDL